MTPKESEMLREIYVDMKTFLFRIERLEKDLDGDAGHPGVKGGLDALSKNMNTLALNQEACVARLAHSGKALSLHQQVLANWVAFSALLVAIAVMGWQMYSNKANDKFQQELLKHMSEMQVQVSTVAPLDPFHNMASTEPLKKSN